jgi:hypothetical protein
VGSFTDISMEKSLLTLELMLLEFIVDVDVEVNSVFENEFNVVLYERLQMVINETNTKKAAPNFKGKAHIFSKLLFL